MRLFSHFFGDINITIDALILISVLITMVILFVLELLPMEVTAMGAVAVLLLFDILTWDEAIMGFSNQAVVTIGAIFIMSRSLVKTGFLEVFADFIAKKGGEKKWLTIIILSVPASKPRTLVPRRPEELHEAPQHVSCSP